MHVIVLGAAGTYPGPGKPCAGFLVRHHDTTLLLDCGPGVLGPLMARMRPEDLDGIVVSHIHPDHCSDVFVLQHYLTFGPVTAGIPLPAMAPEGAVDVMARFAQADGDQHPFFTSFAWDTIRPGDRRQVGSLELSFGYSDHPVPTLATRITADGRVLAYSADTGRGGDAFAVAAGADLFMCEATWQSGDDWIDGLHMSAAAAGELAAAADVKRLLLTHLRPEVSLQRSAEEAATEFGRDVLLAVPGLEVTV